MSFTSETTIWCDMCGGRHQASGGRFEVKKEALRLGWELSNKQQLYPDCKEKQNAEDEKTNQK